MDEIKTSGVVHHNLDALARRTLSRAALLLAASRSDNVRNQAFRILVQKYGVQANSTELEIEQAELATDALRDIARVKA
jgi:hypothetical protein